MKQQDRIHLIDFEMHIRRWMYGVKRWIIYEETRVVIKNPTRFRNSKIFSPNSIVYIFGLQCTT